MDSTNPRNAAGVAGDSASGGTPPHAPVRPLRLLSEAEVLARIPIGRSKLFAMIKAGEFPASVPLGTAKNGLGRPARVGWAEHEVDAWIADAIRRRPGVSPKGAGASADAPVSCQE